MKERTADNIVKHLKAAGLDEASAKMYSMAAGLSGDKARQFIKDHKLPEITPGQQKALFAISYAEMEEDVKRISNKKDVVETYGKTDWDKLHPAIKDLVIDLRFRGDYTPSSRKLIQKHLVNNDLKALATAIADESNWKGVPPDRFKRRRDYALNAIKK